MVKRNRGFLLVEVLVALALAGCIGCGVAQLVGTASASATQAGDAQLAAVTGMRLVDEALALGHDTLRQLAEGTGEPTCGTALEVDGVDFVPVLTVQAVDRGLLKLTLELSWADRGPRKSVAVHRMRLVRLVADPLSPVGGSAPRSVPLWSESAARW